MRKNSNKKLIIHFLLSLGLIANVFNNNKITNAAVTSKSSNSQEKSKLNDLITKVKNVDNIERCYAAYNQLVKSVEQVLINRQNKKSALKDSMIKNNIELEENIKTGNLQNLKKQEKIIYDSKADMNKISDDLILMNDFLTNMENAKGGHFTAWKKGVSTAVNELKNKVNYLATNADKIDNATITEWKDVNDEWFTKLKCSNQEIDDYKINFKKQKENFSYIDNISELNLDNAWNDSCDKNIEAKKIVLENVIKFYCAKNGRKYFKGHDKWAEIVIDEFVGGNNKNITKDVEAKIYCVYEKIMNLFYDGEAKCLLNYDDFENSFYFHEMLFELNKSIGNSLLIAYFQTGMSILKREKRILLLDKIISESKGKLSQKDFIEKLIYVFDQNLNKFNENEALFNRWLYSNGKVYSENEYDNMVEFLLNKNLSFLPDFLSKDEK